MFYSISLSGIIDIFIINVIYIFHAFFDPLSNKQVIVYDYFKEAVYFIDEVPFVLTY